MTDTAGSPRATIILLTYAQARFAGAAARACLAQDYPNLEIILSDDCSPDDTLAVLRSEAAASGREAIVRSTGRNLGLVAHLYDAARLASGELVVVAAGDDLSYPDRVSRLVERWLETGADALHSNWDVIDADGALVRRGRPPGRSDLRIEQFFPGGPAHRIIGATAAYARSTFEAIPCPAERIFAEDLYFSLFLNAFGRRVSYVETPLIAYREHDLAITHGGAGRSVHEHERAIERESKRIVEVLDAFAKGSRATPWGEPKVDWAALAEDREFNRFRASWTSAGTIARLRALVRFSAPSQRRWLLPRLLGPGPLAAAKALVRRG